MLVCLITYLQVSDFSDLCFHMNSIDIGLREVQAKLIKTRSKLEMSDPIDMSDCKNPVITLDPMGHDLSD